MCSRTSLYPLGAATLPVTRASDCQGGWTAALTTEHPLPRAQHKSPVVPTAAPLGGCFCWPGSYVTSATQGFRGQSSTAFCRNQCQIFAYCKSRQGCGEGLSLFIRARPSALGRAGDEVPRGLSGAPDTSSHTSAFSSLNTVRQGQRNHGIQLYTPISVSAS